ncbi:MAG: S8 family serine peptidase [Gaiellaceae bacterium MAG52_C11]|nr:S8 family serine peptidase [Candidatus Gaiellasilicea maunaloa]
MRRVAILLPLLLLALAASAGAAREGTSSEPTVEVVVALEAESLAVARPGRTLAATGGRRLSLSTATSRSYLRTLAASQQTLETRIEAAIPQAEVRWRYRIVANGLAVVVPRDQVERLASVPGVARVYSSVRYTPLLDRGPQQIGAPALWGPSLSTAGQGIKIGIIDEGIDQTHPLFDPAGFAMPAGYPKGQTSFTTAKVIVARAFPPARPAWKHASKPFDPELSSHGTHVAGIAAGNANTLAEGRRISGVAPRAYLGNYKALTIPTDADVGLDGNSPELVAAIEAAVADGMDVINLSLGEPEIEPSRDIVVAALSAAAAAGVVPVVAAGNDFRDFGNGSVSSPGSTPEAITVGAVTTTQSGPANVIAGFSAGGPTPLTLQLKPEVSAPGVAILSAAPRRSFVTLSGTSMAAPHVAGSVALLRQRHPSWTPAQLKAALALTGDPAFADETRTVEAPTPREGGGVVNLRRADAPLLFASPVALSFGLVPRGATLARSIALTDAGGGNGEWAANVEHQTGSVGVTVSIPPSVVAPGTLPVSLTTAADAPDSEVTGFVVLTQGAERRRIPFWLRVSTPALAGAKATPLAKQGAHRATTRGGSSLVARYRYPESPEGKGFETNLTGPERVFRLSVSRPVANVGVVVTSRARGVRVEPRIVYAGNENRLTGYAALPFNLNPYLRTFEEPVLAAGILRPARGAYDVVFDSPSAGSAGAFAFRYWVNDVTPPRLAFRTRVVARGALLTVGATDSGAGVDASSLVLRVDGRERGARIAGGAIRVPTGSLARGRHSLVLQLSDYQETRNNENVLRILPNTAFLRTSFTVR